MATHPQDEAQEVDGDELPDDEQEELDEDPDNDEAEATPTPRNQGGRPSTGGKSKGVGSATAVFKKQEDLQAFLDDAAERNQSPSAYALHVLLNRDNTAEGAADWKQEKRRLLSRITALEGAKEQLQGMYEAERQRMTQGGGLSGVEATAKPLTTAEFRKAVEQAILERDNNEKLKLLPLVQKELEDTKTALAKLKKEYEDLEDELEEKSDFEAKAKTYGPVMGQTLAGFMPGLAAKLSASLASSPLGQLAGISPEGNGIGAAEQSSDPLIQAALRVRDNISPAQGRELLVVLDAIATHPQFIERFAGAIRQYEATTAAQQQS